MFTTSAGSGPGKKKLGIETPVLLFIALQRTMAQIVFILNIVESVTNLSILHNLKTKLVKQFSAR